MESVQQKYVKICTNIWRTLGEARNRIPQREIRRLLKPLTCRSPQPTAWDMMQALKAERELREG